MADLTPDQIPALLARLALAASFGLSLAHARLFAAVFVLLGTPAVAQTFTNPYGTQWSTAGVDIPTRTTVCATIPASTYGYGEQNAAPGIQAALTACPAGQVVLLGHGRFRMDDAVRIPSHVTLRGAGQGATVLEKPKTTEAEHVILIGSTRYGRTTDTTAVNLTADAIAGTYSVTVTDATGFAAGQFVKLDADEWTSATWRPDPPLRDGTTMEVWGTDRVTYRIRRPTLNSTNISESSLDDYSRFGRVIAEIKEVASVAGNVITFTSPIHIDYPVAKASQLVRYTNENVHSVYSGVEDLTCMGGTDGCIRVTTAAYSWAKNIECTHYGGPCVDIHQAFRFELRDSYIHHTNNPVPGGGGYALSMRNGASECLIENNIIIWANKLMVARASGAGSVIAYNYAQDSLIAYDLAWAEVGLNASHYPAPHHVLFEGNQSSNYDSDATFGGSIYMTVFRNWLEGERRSFPWPSSAGGRPARAVGLGIWSWWHAFYGNVLGTPDLSGLPASKWLYEDTCDGSMAPSNLTLSCANNYLAMWRLGYAGFQMQLADPFAQQTAIREGNYDYLTRTVTWSGGPVTLPDSLYLTEKPAFFGELPWPWVTPDRGVVRHVLPAQRRYECMMQTAECVAADTTLQTALAQATAERDEARAALAALHTQTETLLTQIRQALAAVVALVPEPWRPVR